MSKLNADQLAGFRRQSQPPVVEPRPREPQEQRAAVSEAPVEKPTGPRTVRPARTPAVATDHQKGSKAVIHLPKSVASQLRSVASRTGFPMSRLLTAAVAESSEKLHKELDGGVPLLRRRPEPGREAFTLWLPASTRATLKELSDAGGISVSEVAARALEPFLKRLELGVMTRQY